MSLLVVRIVSVYLLYRSLSMAHFFPLSLSSSSLMFSSHSLSSWVYSSVIHVLPLWWSSRKNRRKASMFKAIIAFLIEHVLIWSLPSEFISSGNRISGQSLLLQTPWDPGMLGVPFFPEAKVSQKYCLHGTHGIFQLADYRGISFPRSQLKLTPHCQACVSHRTCRWTICTTLLSPQRNSKW